MKVVTLSSICSLTAIRSPSVSSAMDWTLTPFTPQASAILAYSTPTFSSVPTKLSSYHSVVLRFSAPHW